MFGWLKKLLKVPEPAGPPELIKRFSPDDEVISKDIVKPDSEGWVIDCEKIRSIPLFEIPNPHVEQTILEYKAKIKCENLEKDSYIEMWCRIPGKGEFFSKALNQKIKGTTEWISAEAPFFLKKGQCPDLLRLNFAAGGKGKVWIKEIELWKTPLK